MEAYEAASKENGRFPAQLTSLARGTALRTGAAQCTQLLQATCPGFTCLLDKAGKRMLQIELYVIFVRIIGKSSRCI